MERMPWKKNVGVNNHESVGRGKPVTPTNLIWETGAIKPTAFAVARGSETSQYPVDQINRDVVSSGERKR